MMSESNDDVVTSEATRKVEGFIQKKITECKEQKDSEKVIGLVRLLYYVHKEVNEASNSGGVAATRDFLAKFVSTADEDVMGLYLDQVIADTKNAENNPEYVGMLKTFYQRFVQKATVEAEEEEKLSEGIDKKALSGVIVAVSRMSAVELQVFVEVCESSLKSNALAPLALSGQLVKKVGGKVVGGFLVVAQLAWAVFKNMRQWWRGEISGKRCSKNIIDSSASILGGAGVGYAGAAAGATIGGLAGPVGAGVGGILGGAVGAIGGGTGAKKLMEKITEKIFDLPKTVAEEEAYKYMGVNRHASDGQINKVYHKKALECHPDRGGDQEDFVKLQMQLQIIRLARGYDK